MADLVSRLPPALANPLALLTTGFRRAPVLWIGITALVLPTLLAIAQDQWSTDSGAHAPIVLATGLWLVATLWQDVRTVSRPGSFGVTLMIVIPALLLYLVSRLTSLLETEALAAYLLVLGTVYFFIGGAAMRVLWFPLTYLLLIVPIPQSLMDSITQPLKIGISRAAVSLLSAFDYPIGNSGVSIFVGQYELLVAAACAGLNSIVSLIGIGMFYIYLMHKANWRYLLLLALTVVPVAIVANLVRVIILILLTYHFGEAAAQGFFHEFAGLTMFAVAVLTIFAIDMAATPIRHRLEPKAVAA